MENIFTANLLVWVVILLYNLAIILVVRYCIHPIDFASATSEKPQDSPIEPQRQAGAQVGAANTKETTSQLGTSSSRVASMIGGLVMAIFLWNLGSIVIYKSFVKPDDVQHILNGIGTFFLAGSSLFAPYAVNTLGKVFSK